MLRRQGKQGARVLSCCSWGRGEVGRGKWRRGVDKEKVHKNPVGGKGRKEGGASLKRGGDFAGRRGLDPSGAIAPKRDEVAWPLSDCNQTADRERSFTRGGLLRPSAPFLGTSTPLLPAPPRVH